MYLPQARTDHLVVRELPEETLVYDLERNKAHCLNRTVALVWRLCDGTRSPAALCEVAKEKLRLQDAEALVHLALEQLGRRNLLAEASAPAAPGRAIVAAGSPAKTGCRRHRPAAHLEHHGHGCGAQSQPTMTVGEANSLRATTIANKTAFTGGQHVSACKPAQSSWSSASSLRKPWYTTLIATRRTVSIGQSPWSGCHCDGKHVRRPYS